MARSALLPCRSHRPAIAGRFAVGRSITSDSSAVWAWLNFMRDCTSDREDGCLEKKTLTTTAASVTNRNQFVMVATGAVIATAQHIPVSMMLTSEIDIYVEGPDSEAISDQIDGAIGNGSMFHRTFRYYGDGVSPTTAIMPMDWKSRATTYTIPDGTVSASVQVRTMLLSASYARHAKRIVIGYGRH